MSTRTVESGASASGQEPRNEPLSEICAEIAAAVRRTWGRGPVRTTAHWAGPDILVVMLADGHTDQERTLLRSGRADLLRRGRLALQEILEDEMKAIVQGATGRRVATTLGATRVDPDLSAEIFLLADGPPDPSARPSPARVRADASATRRQAVPVRARARAAGHANDGPAERPAAAS